MISNEKYKEVLESGLLLDHFYLLCNINKGVKLVDTKRIQGFINLLTKKDYIKDDTITQKGLDLIEEAKVKEVPIKVSTLITAYDHWVNQLYDKCVDIVEKSTGKKNAKAMIGNSSFYFLPARASDLGKRLSMMMKEYKVKDLDKMETVLLKYVTKATNKQSWFPLLKYYIIKDKESPMFSDMDNSDDVDDSGYVSKVKLL